MLRSPVLTTVTPETRLKHIVMEIPGFALFCLSCPIFTQPTVLLTSAETIFPRCTVYKHATKLIGEQTGQIR